MSRGTCRTPRSSGAGCAALRLAQLPSGCGGLCPLPLVHAPGAAAHECDASPPAPAPCCHAVGTLVSKTMLGAANAPYATPQPGATLISLDVFSLQVRAAAWRGCQQLGPGSA